MADENDRILADEQRKLQQLEQVKREVRNEVHREIKERTDRVEPPDRAQVEGVARQIKHQAIQEVATSEAELGRARTGARVSQIVDYVFYIVFGLIGLQIILELLAARESSGFKQFMNTITYPFLAPFKGLMHDPAVGSSQLMFSYIIALVVYILLRFAVNGALRLLVPKRTEV